ncbi:MAG TPA: helix-turn-helix transcriptional regulator [Candidatus Dorea merdavium]|uniref:helix-turn-helix domain-containing protein n=1 Tax=Massilistercora timonensis TaxID=2086584 RepID=UPI001FA366BF|nr:helix-turn-helix transcriptional regulator [Candidatus Dorea merdavium]
MDRVLLVEVHIIAQYELFKSFLLFFCPFHFSNIENKPLNTTTLNDLCRILDCDIPEICRYIPSDADQPL